MKIKRQTALEHSGNTHTTPSELLLAITKKFGIKFVWDLAADKFNSVCGSDFFGIEQDSLKQDWTKLPKGWLWCNPPFSPAILPWAEKAHKSGRQIALLVPVGSSTKWFREYVFEKSLVVFLTPRPKFSDMKGTGDRDIMLCMFGMKPGVMVWDWVDDKEWSKNITTKKSVAKKPKPEEALIVLQKIKWYRRLLEAANYGVLENGFLKWTDLDNHYMFNTNADSSHDNRIIKLLDYKKSKNLSLCEADDMDGINDLPVWANFTDDEYKTSKPIPLEIFKSADGMETFVLKDIISSQNLEYVHFDHSYGVLFAADGHRLLSRKTSGFEKSFLIPGDKVKFLAWFANQHSATIWLRYSEENVFICGKLDSGSKFVIKTANIGGLNFKKFISPADGQTKFVLPKSEVKNLVNAIKPIISILGDDNNTLWFNGCLIPRGSNMRYLPEIPISVFPSEQTGINLGYFLDILNIASNEDIEIYFPDKVLLPIIFKYPQTTYVLMPMRVPDENA